MENILIENLIKVGMAVLIGGVIGAERELRDRAAGFRTIILITVGSTLFTIFSISLDPGFTQTRIAANIVTGIGFLGAGAIIREHGRVGGLTTAATIWLSAALGMGIGAGEMVFMLITTSVVLVVLIVFPFIERKIDHISESRTYKIVLPSNNAAKKLKDINNSFETCGLRIIEQHQIKSNKSLICTWHILGAPRGHERFSSIMLKDGTIKEFTY